MGAGGSIREAALESTGGRGKEKREFRGFHRKEQADKACRLKMG
jgi:hypothetical protein